MRCIGIAVLGFLLITALTGLPQPSGAVDCATIRQSCVEQCGRGETNPARIQACANRCSVALCRDEPLTARTCDLNAQTLCNNSFRACGNACAALLSIPSVGAQGVDACNGRCCTQLRSCLSLRQCDVSNIRCR